MSKLKVIHRDGSEYEYETVKPPWQWRSFLVIDQGTGRLLYVPQDNVEGFEMQDVAS